MTYVAAIEPSSLLLPYTRISREKLLGRKRPNLNKASHFVFAEYPVEVTRLINNFIWA